MNTHESDLFHDDLIDNLFMISILFVGGQLQEKEHIYKTGVFFSTAALTWGIVQTLYGSFTQCQGHGLF